MDNVIIGQFGKRNVAWNGRMLRIDGAIVARSKAAAMNYALSQVADHGTRKAIVNAIQNPINNELSQYLENERELFAKAVK